MTHIVYGYKIERGILSVDEEAAKNVTKMYEEYLNGKSLDEVGKVIGKTNNHSRISNILKCKKYLGDEFFPKILDEELFEKVQEEMEGRKKKPRPKRVKKFEYEYVLNKPSKKYTDPYRQAEYAYSMVERRVKSWKWQIM